MLPTTFDIIRAALKADPTLSPEDRARLLALIRKGPSMFKIEAATIVEPRLIHRAEVARRLACSLRTLDNLAADGVLKKRRLPGRIRAAGFLESDVTALITG